MLCLWACNLRVHSQLNDYTFLYTGNKCQEHFMKYYKKINLMNTLWNISKK